MKSYLKKSFDWKTESIADVYDEMPLWTANFGQFLLENFPIKAYEEVLDVGFGTGFPLIEIAQRLGQKSNIVGIDPWGAGAKRAKKKIEAFNLFNIEIILDDAAKMPFRNERFDLIVSNLGINNFASPERVLTECFRVLKPGGIICSTSNLTGTFQEFFDIFGKTLIDSGLEKHLPELKDHIAHRGTVESISEIKERAGFEIKRKIERSFSMRFLNGTAFLNHSFIILGFIEPWKKILQKNELEFFFNRFEAALNSYASKNGELKLTVPMCYFEAVKPL